MPVFDLEHLGRNVIPVSATRCVVITNTSDATAHVLVHLKNGGAWRPFREPVTLEPGAHWSVAQVELGAGQVLVVAQGRNNGRNIVRVEY
jgi:hypothetical protein